MDKVLSKKLNEVIIKWTETGLHTKGKSKVLTSIDVSSLHKQICETIDAHLIRKD